MSDDDNTSSTGGPTEPERRVDIVEAKYTSTGVDRFKGNPFIEALPPLERKKSAYLTMLSHSPPVPTNAVRKKGEVARLMELSALGDLVIPFPEYQKAGLTLATMIRSAYVSRNPLAALDRRRRHALATEGATGIEFPKDWKSSAGGHLMVAVSGMGKTTFARAFLLRYPQVIRHTAYKETAFHCVQVVYVFLRVPHDATLKSLCIQFFDEIDRLLGTHYARQARALRNIAPMVQLMNVVATAVSLGFMVVDEVQNLKSASGANATFVLNFFSEVIEKLGISLLVLATPAIQSVVDHSVRNVRKLASEGETIISPMPKNDPQWDIFCEAYWEYSFVKKKGALSKDVKNAWHKASAGNSAFAALAFVLSQRNEIGESEIIDASAFERTMATDMAFLQPAITALRSGDPAQLRAFDDLLFSPKYTAMRKLLGATEALPKNGTSAEFDDLEDDAPKGTVRRKSKSSKSATPSVAPNLPMENPLSM